MPAAIQVLLTADRAFKLMNFLQYLGPHLCEAGGGKPVSEREGLINKSEILVKIPLL